MNVIIGDNFLMILSRYKSSDKSIFVCRKCLVDFSIQVNESFLSLSVKG